MKRYIAKKDTWFMEGTEAILETDLGIMNAGIFRGKLLITEDDHDYIKMGYKVGDIIDDGEVCPYDEFNIIEE